MRVKRQSKVAEDVAGEVLNKICSGEYPIGSMLPPEAQMLTEYGIGRASLRESLRILEVHGVIRIKAGPGGGPVVQKVGTNAFASMAKIFFQVDGMTYREVVDARLILEPFFARMAAIKRDPEYIETLLASSIDLGDDKRYLSSAHDFHRLIGSMSSNRMLNLFAHALADIFHERVAGMLYPPEKRGDVVAEHRAIAEAIQAGDADLAERLMREHMEEYSDYVAVRYPALLDEKICWVV